MSPHAEPTLPGGCGHGVDADIGARPSVLTRSWRRVPAGDLTRRFAGTVVGIEVGAAIALLILASDGRRWPLALAVGVVAVVLTLLRRGGRGAVGWILTCAAFTVRTRHHVAEGDSRVDLLRLVLGDLVVGEGVDHRRRPVGFAWHGGVCTAVMVVQAQRTVVRRVHAEPLLSLAVLADCLADRGGTLDAITVTSDTRAAGPLLPAAAAAASAYRQLVGELPVGGMRTTLIGVRLDPRRCPLAVAERGGGSDGAHRILLAALARIQGVLAGGGLQTRVLDSDELVHSFLRCVGLAGPAAAPTPGARSTAVALRERWSTVSAGGVGHRSYAVTAWPHSTADLDGLAGVRASSTTVTLSLRRDSRGGVSVGGLVRVGERTPSELEATGHRLTALGRRAGIRLAPLDGMQASALRQTLPTGGPG